MRKRDANDKECCSERLLSALCAPRSASGATPVYFIIALPIKRLAIGSAAHRAPCPGRREVKPKRHPKGSYSELCCCPHNSEYDPFQNMAR